MSPWGHKELDTTEQLTYTHTHTHTHTHTPELQSDYANKFHVLIQTGNFLHEIFRFLLL